MKNAEETRRIIWRHPKGIYETVEVSGTGVFGVPYSYRETVYTANRDARGVAHKEIQPAPPNGGRSAHTVDGQRRKGNLRNVRDNAACDCGGKYAPLKQNGASGARKAWCYDAEIRSAHKEKPLKQEKGAKTS